MPRDFVKCCRFVCVELLITSLSDTLTEHPELIAAAKKGFSKYLDAYPNSGK